VQYKDADRVLTVLSDKLGRVTVKARGVSRKNSRLASAAQLFSCSDMVLYENQGRYTLNEAQVIEQFEGLRSDINRMALASYFAEVLACEEEGEQTGGDELLRLALNCLYALSSGKYPESLIKAAFELRYMAISGYEPDLYFCSGCGEELSRGRAIPERGEMYCPNCAAPFGIDLTENATSAARHMLSCDLKKLLSVTVTLDECQSLSDFSGRYMRACLERGFKTLDFYNTCSVPKG
jgi:DNA repair protein RecO (recombination protein O)